jgi:hypothetical protein
MAQIGTSGFWGGLLPRFPLEMVVASLATFLGTAVWFDLPGRLHAYESPPAEKLTLQAEPLPIRMFQPTDDHQTSAFMEAVALSHVAPLRPQSEVDRAALNPPAAVQVMARMPGHEKPRVAASVPVPAPRPPEIKMASLPSGPLAPAPHAQVQPSLRPPAPIPAAGLRVAAPERHDFMPTTVREAANSARVAVTGSLDSLGRGIDALIHWR